MRNSEELIVIEKRCQSTNESNLYYRPQDLLRVINLMPITMRKNYVLAYCSIVLILVIHTSASKELLIRNSSYSFDRIAEANIKTKEIDFVRRTGESSSTNASTSSQGSSTNDNFGTKKIYPTREGGREWYINMDDPRSDGIFFITSDSNITRQADGSWRVNNTNVRLNVDTPQGVAPWRDVEITGYAKVVGAVPIEGNSLANTDDLDLNWLARGGRHTSEIPCEGSALTAILDINGTVGWKKEIWFPGGYADERETDKVVTDSLLNRWIGFKAIMYNTNNNTNVKMESYIDNRDTNYWVQVTNLTDNGNWYAKSPDSEFNRADCGRPKNYVITNGGSIVTFRSDNIVWDFKNLSVREIQAP
jgi:hypothetical protein